MHERLSNVLGFRKFFQLRMVFQSSVPKVSDGQAQRTELLDVLSDVKTKVQDKIGAVDFPLPQFILIGKQSVCRFHGISIVILS